MAACPDDRRIAFGAALPVFPSLDRTVSAPLTQEAASTHRVAGTPAGQNGLPIFLVSHILRGPPRQSQEPTLTPGRVVSHCMLLFLSKYAFREQVILLLSEYSLRACESWR